MTLYLSLSEPAGSRALDRFVRPFPAYRPAGTLGGGISSELLRMLVHMSHLGVVGPPRAAGANTAHNLQTTRTTYRASFSLKNSAVWPGSSRTVTRS